MLWGTRHRCLLSMDTGTSLKGGWEGGGGSTEYLLLSTLVLRTAPCCWGCLTLCLALALVPTHGYHLYFDLAWTAVTFTPPIAVLISRYVLAALYCVCTGYPCHPGVTHGDREDTVSAVCSPGMEGGPHPEAEERRT